MVVSNPLITLPNNTTSPITYIYTLTSTDINGCSETDDIEVVVLDVDEENRRLSLGHKQLEENPWDTFESVFTKGSVHKCTILSKNDKGAVLELPYGIEGFATTKNLLKEDGSNANAGETLDFRVTEFSKDDKRIVLSHSATFMEEKPKPVKKKTSSSRSSSNKINKDVEKATLGDLEALSALKVQMEDDKKASVKAAAKKAATAKEEELDDEEVEAKKAAKAKKKATPKAKKNKLAEDEDE